MIAAIYARVSSQEQAERDNSIPAQIRLIREYCTKNGISIHDEYIDEGISGQKENRPAFQKMIADDEKSSFDLILVHKFDRFARKIELSHKIKGRLKKSNVNVISITEPIEDSPMGFFVEGLHELLAEYYIKNLSKEVKKGMGERALKGKYMGQAPYGYYIQNGEIKINDDQANVVRQIYTLYLNGWGHLKIAKWLNNNSIPTYAGLLGSWQTVQVIKILKNPKYIGKMMWDDKLYDSDFPAIIDTKTFTLAQLQIGKKADTYTYRGSNYDKFELLGLLYCGSCGCAFRIKANNKRRKCYYYAYLCHNAALYRGKCTATRLHRQEDIEKEVIDHIKERAKDTKKDFTLVHKKPLDVSDILDDRLKRIEKELDRAKEAYLAGVFTVEEYKEEKLKKENEKQIIELDLQKRTDETKAKKEYRKFLRTKLDEYNAAKTIQDKKNVLLTFIDKILVYTDDTISISYYRET
jgi:site-specific DNA recombinase